MDKTQNERKLRDKILMIIAVVMLICIITIGAFAIPVGITSCAIIGLCYGLYKKDRLFTKWSVAALLIGILLTTYTICLIGSM